MGLGLAICALMSVVVNDLNFISVARPINETYPILIVDPNAPPTSTIAFEPLESVAWRYFEERYLRRCIKQQ